MLFNNLISFLVVIFVFSTQTPPDKPFLPPALTLVLLLFCLTLYAVVAGRVFARVSGPNHYFAAEKRLSLLAVLLFVGCVYVFDLKYYLAPLSFGGTLPVLTDVAGLICFFVLLAIMWGQGRAQYARLFQRPGSLFRFILTNITVNLPIVLPWLILSLVFDFLKVLPIPAIQQILRSPWGDLVLFGFFVVFLSLFFPPLVRYLWGCRPLPPGPLRDHISKFCRDQSFHAEILHWPLFEGQALTAGILGIVPGLRYLMITPALLEALSTEELDGVVAHEIGHVKRFHLVLYIVLFLGFSLLAGALAKPLPHLILAGDLYYLALKYLPMAPETLLGVFATAPLLVLMLIYFRFIFGYFIRNFERQANGYVFAVQGTSGPLVASFEKIAQLSGGNRDEKNWHHFGIGQRVDFLKRCERDRSLIRRHDRKLYFSLIAYFLCIGLAVLGLQRVDAEQLVSGYETRYAEAVLLQKVRLEPSNSLWLIVLGDFLQSRNMEKRAVDAYEKALALTPLNPEVNNNLAWLLLTAQDRSILNPSRALTLAKTAVLYKEHGYNLDTLAMAYWANRQVAEAIEAETRALELDPKNQGFYQSQIEKFKNRQWGEPEDGSSGKR